MDQKLQEKVEAKGKQAQAKKLRRIIFHFEEGTGQFLGGLGLSKAQKNATFRLEVLQQVSDRKTLAVTIVSPRGERLQLQPERLGNSRILERGRVEEIFTTEYVSGTDVKDNRDEVATSIESSRERIPQQAATDLGPFLDLVSETLPASELPGPLLRLKEELVSPKQIVRSAFEARLGEMVGWRGTPEENGRAAEGFSEEATKCGLRFCYDKAGQTLAVSLAYRDGVFVLTADGGKYVASSKDWPKLSVTWREIKAGKKGAKGDEPKKK